MTTAALPAAKARPEALTHEPVSFMPLRAIVVKEVFENLKFLFLILLALGLCVVSIVWDDTGHFNKPMHPDSALLDGSFLTFSIFICPIAAFCFGLAQIFSERSTDLRTFFLQRSITPSRLFLAKALAGLLLYFLAVGVPILLLILISAANYNAAYIFDLRFTYPYIADFFTGIAYYFAALLVAQRQARLYASRLFPILAAIFVSVCSGLLPQLWQALAVVGILDLLFALSAWNCYIHAGLDQPLGQPGRTVSPGQARINSRNADGLPRSLEPAGLSRTARAAFPFLMMLAVSMLFGSCFFFLSLTIRNLTFYLPRDLPAQRVEFSAYQQTSDGRLIRVRYRVEADPSNPMAYKGARHDYFDLAGNALPAPSTQSDQNGRDNYSHPFDAREFTRQDLYNVVYDGPGVTPPPATYQQRWYYFPDRHYFAGYDTNTHQRVATIGSTGLIPANMPTQPFTQDCLFGNYFAVDNALYLPDFFNTPHLEPYFTLPPGERPQRIELLWNEATGPLAGNWVGVLTDKNIHLLLEHKNHAESILTIPLDHPLSRETLEIGHYVRSHRLVFWYRPLPLSNRNAGVYVTYDESTKTTTREEAPPLSDPLPPIQSSAYPRYVTLIGMVDSFTNPLFAVGLRWQYSSLADPAKWYSQSVDPQFNYGPPLAANYYTGLAIPPLLCALIVLLLTRRYRFSWAGTLLWPLATLLLGPVGLVTFLFTQPLPARIPCPHCHKKRLVTRELCEHCRAPCPPPPANGSEIIAPMGVSA